MHAHIIYAFSDRAHTVLQKLLRCFVKRTVDMSTPFDPRCLLGDFIDSLLVETAPRLSLDRRCLALDIVCSRTHNPVVYDLACAWGSSSRVAT